MRQASIAYLSFFVKQKTAYEMRISDWSSDVCSSDLVWNDDAIAAQSGFPPHPHRDMEIITYVRTGAISHRDSMGNAGRTAAGDVQVMSAGTGVTHSEFNLEDEETTLFQIWIMPDRDGGNPGWGRSEEHTSELQSLMR